MQTVILSERLKSARKICHSYLLSLAVSQPQPCLLPASLASYSRGCICWDSVTKLRNGACRLVRPLSRYAGGRRGDRVRLGKRMLPSCLARIDDAYNNGKRVCKNSGDTLAPAKARSINAWVTRSLQGSHICSLMSRAMSALCLACAPA